MSARFRPFLKTLGLLFAFIAFGLYFDSSSFIALHPKGQWTANCLMLAVFMYLWFKGTRRAKELMIYALLIGIGGECLFSLVFNMYEYRLHNIPVYVPPGHAILYITTYYFGKEKMVKVHKKAIEKGLVLFILTYTTFFLVFKNDVFGFVLTLLIIFLLRNKARERLFYYTMYLVVAFLEIVGTRYQCWMWPDTAFGIFPLLKSANPPSGISFFYFGLDLGSLWLYKQRHRVAWHRMKAIRLISRHIKP
jgi:hypothetical protein